MMISSLRNLSFVEPETAQADNNTAIIFPQRLKKMDDNDEFIRLKNIEAQRSVLAGLERCVPKSVNDDSSCASAQEQEQQQGMLFDPILPTEFSREAIMFVRYAVDCLGAKIFDLAPDEVQKLWLDFCIEFNTGSSLSEDWYRATTLRDESFSGPVTTFSTHSSSAAAAGQRLIRLDATTWPSLDKSTAHDWNLKVDDDMEKKMAEAARMSTQLAQSHWRSFFLTQGRPATF